MTREEEIQKLIDEENGIDNYGSADYQVGVCDGVRLADANPKSPWISVDDDLPCNHIEHKYHEKAFSTKDVLIRRADNSYSIDCMMVRDEKWDWVLGSLIGIYPTHWMPIPKIPKE